MSNYQVMSFEAFWRNHELSPAGVYPTLLNYGGFKVDNPKNRRKAYDEYVARLNKTDGVMHKTKPVVNPTPSKKVIKM